MNLNVEFEGFEGPFDLLLKLIEKEKIDVYDINLSDITNKYLEEIKKLDREIDDISSFIYIASVLISIKANKLLPKDEEEYLEEDFLAYLIEYKKIKSIQNDMKYLEEQASKSHSKYQEDLSKFKTTDELIAKDVKILKREFEKLLKSLDEEARIDKKVEIVSMPDINDYIGNYRKALDIREELRLDLITNNIHSKVECIASFLALLELFKLREIYLTQKDGNKFHIKKRM